MDKSKKYGEKYSALRAAAAHKQRQQRRSHVPATGNGGGDAGHASRPRATSAPSAATPSSHASNANERLPQQHAQMQQEPHAKNGSHITSTAVNEARDFLIGTAAAANDDDSNSSGGEGRLATKDTGKQTSAAGDESGTVRGERGKQSTTTNVVDSFGPPRNDASLEGTSNAAARNDGRGRSDGGASGDGSTKSDARGPSSWPTSSSAFPPRRPPIAAPTASAGAVASSSVPSARGGERPPTGRGAAVAADAAATPARRAASPSAAPLVAGRYTTPNSTAFRPPPAGAGGGRGAYDYGDGEGEGGGGSPPPPATPLTMMRNVMSSISRDRSEIEGARRGCLFGDNGGRSADVGSGEGDDRKGARGSRSLGCGRATTTVCHVCYSLARRRNTIDASRKIVSLPYC